MEQEREGRVVSSISRYFVKIQPNRFKTLTLRSTTESEMSGRTHYLFLVRVIETERKEKDGMWARIMANDDYYETDCSEVHQLPQF